MVHLPDAAAAKAEDLLDNKPAVERMDSADAKRPTVATVGKTNGAGKVGGFLKGGNATLLHLSTNHPISAILLDISDIIRSCSGWY